MTVNPHRIPRARYKRTLEPLWAHNEVSVTPFGPVLTTYRPPMTPFDLVWPNTAPSGLQMAP